MVLVEPEIPQNTGSIARLCAATETTLHLIAPLGFTIADRRLKRAGLDYWKYVDVRLHESWQKFWSEYGGERLLFFSKRGAVSYTCARYERDCFLVFGPETRGLAQELLAANWERVYCIPMPGRGVRSLNLANAVSIVVYEALRQTGRV
ncbi:MAG TPA: tRNA (cytidine(34)-2'-O)-methyltransferase [Candidatus Acidoferrales bacterium]|nr:tRNA (cytidine(34)-2'-O)-methyltransferase [Candidatus Acidoferrales bacterium]